MGGVNPFRKMVEDGASTRRDEPYPWERRNEEEPLPEPEKDWKPGAIDIEKERLEIVLRMANIDAAFAGGMAWHKRGELAKEKMKLQGRLSELKMLRTAAFKAGQAAGANGGGVPGKSRLRQEAVRKAWKDYDPTSVKCLMACALRMLKDAAREVDFTEGEYQAIHDIGEWVSAEEMKARGVDVPRLNKPIDDDWLP